MLFQNIQIPFGRQAKHNHDWIMLWPAREYFSVIMIDKEVLYFFQYFGFFL